MADTADGETVMNTGGLVLAAAPGLSVNVGGDVWLRARADVPVYTRLDGTQDVGVTMFASVQMLVH